MIRNARVDVNQPEIVRDLRKAGCRVLIVSQLKNCFDILVGYGGKNYCFEIKDGSKVPSGRRLTEGERKFFVTWKGQVDVIHTAEEALEIINK